MTITFENVKSLLGKKYYLSEYEGGLDNSLDVAQEAIFDGNKEPIWQMIGGWEDSYAEREAVEDAKRAIVEKFGTYGEAWIDDEENIQDLYDEIRARDASTPVGDLIRRTSDQVFFYDLNYDPQWEHSDGSVELLKEVKRIKKIIKLKTDDHDGAIATMIAQGVTSFSHLVVFFKTSLARVMFWSDGIGGKITFSNDIALALYDRVNGAGDHCHIKNHEFSLNFTSQNLWIDAMKYTYTHDVCFMSSEWAKTKVDVRKGRKPQKEIGENSPYFCKLKRNVDKAKREMAERKAKWAEKPAVDYFKE